MKKHLLILGMVACLLGATACGNAEVKEAVLTQEIAMTVAEQYISAIDQIAEYDLDDDMIDANAEAIEQYFGVTADVAKEASTSYKTALEDLGTYQGVQSVEFTENTEKSTAEIKATVLGDQINPKGEVRTAEVLISIDLKTGAPLSILTNVNYTFGEMMTTAGLNTVLGICTVFMVLIILMVIISCFKIINNIEKAVADKKAGKTTTKADSVDNAVAQIAANEEAQDDTELIAVIAAAIAASEGAASADGYVVRSVRRRY